MIIDWDFSAGAKVAIEEAKKDIFQTDWKKVFEPEQVKKVCIRLSTGRIAKDRTGPTWFSFLQRGLI